MEVSVFDHIVKISDRGVTIQITDEARRNGTNLMNMHLVLTDGPKTVIGEVEYVVDNVIEVRFLGEIINGKFQSGLISKVIKYFKNLFRCS